MCLDTESYHRNTKDLIPLDGSLGRSVSFKACPMAVLADGRRPMPYIHSWKSLLVIFYFSLGSFFFLDQEAIACLDREEPK